jgi:hypothetical protein
VPVEFLSDEQAAGFASFQGAPTRTELEKYFFLDDAGREAIEGKRRDHNRLGFAVQLGVARFLRRFLPDPRQIPVEDRRLQRHRLRPPHLGGVLLRSAAGRPARPEAVAHRPARRPGA